MKWRHDRKSARRTRTDPTQLGLFDAPVAPTPVAPTPSTTKSRRSGAVRKPSPKHGPAVLNARDAAAYLGVSVSTLKAWRRCGKGPPHTMLGARMVGYRTHLLDAWLAARTIDPGGADR